MAGISLNIVSTDDKPKDGSFVMTQDDYQGFDNQIDHIYSITDMYVGSDEQVPRETKILDFETTRFKEVSITLPEAVERLFIEVVSNAGDNAERSSRHKVDPGSIEVLMDDNTISVKNGGVPIPVTMKEGKGVYVPEFILGMLLSSSNYNKAVDRFGCGRNGYGSKLTNIFSKEFMVEIGDPGNGKWYRQIWNDNMKVRHEPEIKPYNGPAYVQIVYVLDFERFGYDKYPDEAYNLFARHVAEISYTCKVPATFNGVDLNVRNIKDYARLYLGNTDEIKHVVHYQWPSGVKTKKVKGVEVAENGYTIPEIEVAVFDTPDNAVQVSFANGMCTNEGGIHVDTAVKIFSKLVLDVVNDNEARKIMKSSKIKLQKLTAKDVVRHMSVFISCRIANPKYNSQTKTKLRSPKPDIVITEKKLKSILDWDLIERLHAELEAKHWKDLAKTDGKKRKHINVLKLEDANLAGTEKSQQCTLYVTEGNSAMGYAVTYVSYCGPKARDYMGIYPMKGKPLNVRNAHRLKISVNQEIVDLKGTLGLRQGVDYTIPENFKTLRYGQLIIMADADDDGKHIVGLILNFFHRYYKSLLTLNYIKFIRTPIMKGHKGKNTVKFYTQHEHDLWAKGKDLKGWRFEYYKGLGSSSKKEIQEDMIPTPRMVTFDCDDPIASQSMELAFNKKFADLRKEWIRTWEPDYSIEDLQVLPISDFINHEFIQFSISDLKRSLPRLMDGMKVSQRKVIWGSMLIWGKGHNHKRKVSQVANNVADKTHYHHDEKCLGTTLVTMAQDFVGTNNLPYFTQDGLFGTRNGGGKDAAAARYPATSPEWWWSYVFHRDDNPLLTMAMEEGVQCEPVSLLPIIPLHVINGSLGIGTGHSTFIPNHDPIDVCNWLLSRIRGERPKSILPWYRGFTGNISVRSSKSKSRDTSSDMDELHRSEDAGSAGSAGAAGAGPMRITVDGREVSVDLNTVDSVSDNGSSEAHSCPHSDDSEDIDDFDDDPLGNDDIDVDSNRRTSRIRLSMVTEGRFEVVGNVRQKIIVDELPIGRFTHRYKEWLDKMRLAKQISTYKNYSGDNTVKFEIWGMKNPSIKKLRLRRTFGLTNMVLLDMNDKPVKYDTMTDILEAFYQHRLPYYQQRKDYKLAAISDKVDKFNEKIRFIRMVVNQEIIVFKRPKKELIPEVERHGFNKDILKAVQLYHCTLEQIDKCQQEIDKMERERDELARIAPTDMWITDIEEFLTMYCKKFKCDRVKEDMPVEIVFSNEDDKGKGKGKGKDDE